MQNPRRSLMQQRRSPLTLCSAVWTKWSGSANYTLEETPNFGKWGVSEEPVDSGFFVGGRYSSPQLQLGLSETNELIAFARSIVWRRARLRERALWIVSHDELPRLVQRASDGAEWSRLWEPLSPEAMHLELKNHTPELKAWETLRNLTFLSGESAENRHPLRVESGKVFAVENAESLWLQDGLIYGATGQEAVQVVQLLVDEGLVDVSTTGRSTCSLTITDEGRQALEAGRSGAGLVTPRTVLDVAQDVERSNHHPLPDFTLITAAIPEFDELLQNRWKEADACHRAGAYFSAIVLMGSILEAVLVARAKLQPPSFWTVENAPKSEKGKVRPIEEWGLGHLIAVAVEQQWLSPDRSHFGHALKESRNVVHPCVHIRTKLEFDERTARTCWEVLQGSIEDLSDSLRQNDLESSIGTR